MSIGSSNSASLTPSGSTPKSVRFKINYNLKSLLLNFVNEKDSNLYEELLCHIRDVGQEIRDDDLCQLLKEARGCISILDTNFRLFVQVVLILRWTHRSDEVVSEYQGFLQDLCSAHSYYTKIVIEHLVTSFKSDTSDWIDYLPLEKSRQCFSHLHQAVRSILTVIPMSKELLLNSIRNSYPYFKRPTSEQQSFIFNILQIVQYEPSMRSELLKIIIDKLILLDAHSPRSQLEDNDSSDKTAMDIDCEGAVFLMEDMPTKVESPVSESLDISLMLLFRFLWSETHDEDGHLIGNSTNNLYINLLKSFNEVILPTHATHHVQFLVFYFLSFNTSLSRMFLQMLWGKVSNLNIPGVIRQAAVCYIASLAARASYIPLFVVKDIISEMASWIHSYIDKQDGSEYGSMQNTRVHGVFYTTCQALFYIIAFRHKDLTQNKGLIHLQSLGLSTIVTCRLNPLRVCLPVVVSNFASVARLYQLAYCYTVIEHNSRNTMPTVYRDAMGSLSGITHVHLENFFPFDPYLLKKSKQYIDPIYREYVGSPEQETKSIMTSKEEDEDDFLDSNNLDQQSALKPFSYSSSPGFLQL